MSRAHEHGRFIILSTLGTKSERHKANLLHSIFNHADGRVYLHKIDQSARVSSSRSSHLQPNYCVANLYTSRERRMQTDAISINDFSLL